jgi:nitric oxide reductase large subunit
MLPLIACIAGCYLGLYFNILAVLPFSILGAGSYFLSSLAAGQSWFDSAAILLFPMISIQAGYIIGLTAREPYGQLLGRLNISQSKRI